MTTEVYEDGSIHEWFQCHACGSRRESMVEFCCEDCGHDNSADPESEDDVPGTEDA